ncbi:hypothetical protein COLO4_24302 [Corchorus olitorius]|uniref:RNase H type-1 domain-containing protein n=1 Tax=Corchorus olitorius TaxID=93759 RepID=A0A1R3IBE9_9ROSI|nr:hypothetical protein COLO4_24302 [Corchorus olitorius]
MCDAVIGSIVTDISVDVRETIIAHAALRMMLKYLKEKGIKKPLSVILETGMQDMVDWVNAPNTKDIKANVKAFYRHIKSMNNQFNSLTATQIFRGGGNRVADYLASTVAHTCLVDNRIYQVYFDGNHCVVAFEELDDHIKNDKNGGSNFGWNGSTF